MVVDQHSSTVSSHPNKRNCLLSPTCFPKLFITTLGLWSFLFIIPIVEQQDLLSAAFGRKKPWPRPLMVPRDAEFESMAMKLGESVTFHPMKDLCYADKPLEGHAWFMSTMEDVHAEEGETRLLHFPSEVSLGRVLCLKGNDTHDGRRNYYAVAWPGFLPKNATFIKGLTLVSNIRYNYENMWHGLLVLMPFVGWHQKNGCRRPDRWVLYHKGEIRARMAPWLELMMGATFGEQPTIDTFDGIDDGAPVCFEEAVVLRQDEEMSLPGRTEVYDLIRCKARSYCNVSTEGRPVVGMTMLLRTGARSFRDNAAVVEIFRKECSKFKDCRITVAYANNLSVCEQVELMSRTDILLSPHGAQLTNMFLMDRNSSVMEFFPKGWLELAGVGQYVYRWMAGWSGMRHQEAWRDPNGDPCPHPEDKHQCFVFYKSAKIGHNQTYFSEWAWKVLNETVSTKAESALQETDASSSAGCNCGLVS